MGGGPDANHVFTEIGLAIAAVIAGATVIIGVDTDPVTDFETGDGTADLGDGPGKFVTQNGPGLAVSCALVAVVNVQIGPTDTTGSNFDDDFIWFRLADRDLFDGNLVFSFKNSS